MAHVAKYTKGACGHLFAHYERMKDETGQYIKFGNENIDTSRSHLNYNLAPVRSISQVEFVKQRCSEVQCLNRKDVNVMCSWVVTMPKDFPKEQHKELFQKTYEFLENRYGQKNVVSAYVHLDEVTPHMHYTFVPIVYDKKKGIEKVSAKERVSKADLKSFHPDLEKYLERSLGRKISILNEATKEGNKSIEELKRGTAQEKLKIIARESDNALVNLEMLVDNTKTLEEKKKALEGQIDDFKKTQESVTNNVTKNKTILGKVKSVTMPIETYNACVSAYMRADHSEKRAEYAEKELKKLQGTMSLKRMIELTKENVQLKENVAEQTEALRRINSVFENHPEFEKMFLNAEQRDKEIEKLSKRVQEWDMEL